MDKQTFELRPFGTLLETQWKGVVVILDKDGTRTKGQLGIVAKKSDGDHSWKAYAGVIMHETTLRNDSLLIIKEGAPLNQKEALGFFPDFKGLKYRT